MFFLEILIVVAAYLIGSLSAALIVSKKLGMPDPRSYGSGNPGASNMLRSGRKDAAALTLLGDALKGLIAVWIARAFYAGIDDMGAGVVACAAIAVVLGHMYPVFFGFKGGKGVATALGVLLGMSFWATFWVVLIWAVVAFKFHKSSLASLIAAVCAPFVTFIVLRADHVPSWGWAIFLIAILIVYRHKDNICRLCSGKETAIGQTAGNYHAASATAASNIYHSSAAAEHHQPAARNEIVAAPTVVKETEAVAVVEETVQAEEMDTAQADLRSGDELEEEVIQAAVQQVQQAQEATIQAEQTASSDAVETEPAATETVSEPKKRGRKKSSS